MTMAHFAGFDIADFAKAEHVGKILVAVDVLRKSSSLDLRSESMLECSLVMKIHETDPGEPL